MQELVASSLFRKCDPLNREIKAKTMTATTAAGGLAYEDEQMTVKMSTVCVLYVVTFISVK